MKEKYIKNKSAFTLAEAFVAMIALGILFSITMLNIKGIFVDTNVSSFKKAYSRLEMTISSLVNNDTIYGTLSGFKNTNKVTLTKVNEVLGNDPLYKFRDGFKYIIDPIKDGIACELYTGESSSGCFQTEEGVVWGIPDTDFATTNVIKIKDYDDDLIKVVPITMYVNQNNITSPAENALVATIGYDGKIIFLTNFGGVICSDNSDEIQCKLSKFINAATVKSDKYD